MKEEKFNMAQTWSYSCEKYSDILNHTASPESQVNMTPFPSITLRRSLYTLLRETAQNLFEVFLRIWKFWSCS